MTAAAPWKHSCEILLNAKESRLGLTYLGRMSLQMAKRKFDNSQKSASEEPNEIAYGLSSYSVTSTLFSDEECNLEPQYKRRRFLVFLGTKKMSRPVSQCVIEASSEDSSKEFERLMIIREKELRSARDLLERNYNRAVSEKFKVEQELNATREELRCKVKQADTRYKCLVEELKMVELEGEVKIGKMVEELAKKDEELEKVKVEKEEMTEKLARKDGELNQLRTERNNIIEDLVGRVHFLQEAITKEHGVDFVNKKTTVEIEKTCPKFSPNIESSIHNHKRSCEVDSAVVGENGGFKVEDSQNPVSNQVDCDNCAVGVENILNGSKEQLEKATLEISSCNERGAENPSTLLEAEPSKNVPVVNRPLPSPKVIEISDSEDEASTEGGVSTFRANGSNHTLKLKRKRSVSDSDDSSSSMEAFVRDTAECKKVKPWFDLFGENELADGEKKI